MTAKRAVLFLLLVFATTSAFYLFARNKKTALARAGRSCAVSGDERAQGYCLLLPRHCAMHDL